MPTLIGRLVTSNDGQPETSRRCNVGDLSSDDRELLDVLVINRLVSISNDPATREPVAELAHESLVTEWPELRDIIASSREDARVLRQINAAATDWESGGARRE